ncbi:hypothetical protein TPHV1_170011 [Treponema phagedenis]|uniref:Uncharacterized protein n=1 Tax=Treponema phagedenis TaxID=162 RepID=A0A0B7GWC6_TREPH|nr:hypothetical protein TPHV1_170011 [Treponema phagedenis]
MYNPIRTLVRTKKKVYYKLLKYEYAKTEAFKSILSGMRISEELFTSK